MIPIDVDFDKAANKRVKDLAKAVNDFVLFDEYKQRGWYPVTNCHNLRFNHTVLKQVEEWLTTMCAGQYHVKCHTDYIFELQEDAMMFRLKWS